jgi:hypothetical protein
VTLIYAELLKRLLALNHGRFAGIGCDGTTGALTAAGWSPLIENMD